MNLTDATILLDAAAQVVEAPAWYCGLDNRNGRFPVVIGQVDNADVTFLREEFHFVTNDRGEFLAWLQRPGVRDKLVVFMSDYDRFVEREDISAAMAFADMIIELARDWAISPGELVEIDN